MGLKLKFKRPVSHAASDAAQPGATPPPTAAQDTIVGIKRKEPRTEQQIAAPSSTPNNNAIHRPRIKIKHTPKARAEPGDESYRPDTKKAKLVVRKASPVVNTPGTQHMPHYHLPDARSAQAEHAMHFAAQSATPTPPVKKLTIKLSSKKKAANGTATTSASASPAPTRNLTAANSNLKITRPPVLSKQTARLPPNSAPLPRFPSQPQTVAGLSPLSAAPTHYSTSAAEAAARENLATLQTQALHHGLAQPPPTSNNRTPTTLGVPTPNNPKGRPKLTPTTTASPKLKVTLKFKTPGSFTPKNSDSSVPNRTFMPSAKPKSSRTHANRLPSTHSPNVNLPSSSHTRSLAHTPPTTGPRTFKLKLASGKSSLKPLSTPKSNQPTSAMARKPTKAPLASKAEHGRDRALGSAMAELQNLCRDAVKLPSAGSKKSQLRVKPQAGLLKVDSLDDPEFKPALPVPIASAKPVATKATAAIQLEPLEDDKECIDLRVLKKVMTDLERADRKKFFRDPVTDSIAPGYSTVIEKPMCLRLMRDKLVKYGQYNTFSDMQADARLMFDNCMRYNAVGSLHHSVAITALNASEAIFRKVRAAHAVEPEHQAGSPASRPSVSGAHSEGRKQRDAAEPRSRRDQLPPAEVLGPRRVTHNHHVEEPTRSRNRPTRKPNAGASRTGVHRTHVLGIRRSTIPNARTTFLGTPESTLKIWGSLLNGSSAEAGIMWAVERPMIKHAYRSNLIELETCAKKLSFFGKTLRGSARKALIDRAAATILKRRCRPPPVTAPSALQRPPPVSYPPTVSQSLLATPTPSTAQAAMSTNSYAQPSHFTERHMQPHPILQRQVLAVGGSAPQQRPAVTTQQAYNYTQQAYQTQGVHSHFTAGAHPVLSASAAMSNMTQARALGGGHTQGGVSTPESPDIVDLRGVEEGVERVLEAVEPVKQGL